MFHVEQPVAQSLNEALLLSIDTKLFAKLFMSVVCMWSWDVLFCTLFNCKSHKKTFLKGLFKCFGIKSFDLI